MKAILNNEPALRLSVLPRKISGVCSSCQPRRPLRAAPSQFDLDRAGQIVIPLAVF